MEPFIQSQKLFREITSRENLTSLRATYFVRTFKKEKQLEAKNNGNEKSADVKKGIVDER